MHYITKGISARHLPSGESAVQNKKILSKMCVQHTHTNMYICIFFYICMHVLIRIKANANDHKWTFSHCRKLYFQIKGNSLHKQTDIYTSLKLFIREFRRTYVYSAAQAKQYNSCNRTDPIRYALSAQLSAICIESRRIEREHTSCPTGGKCQPHHAAESYVCMCASLSLRAVYRHPHEVQLTEGSRKLPRLRSA